VTEKVTENLAKAKTDLEMANTEYGKNKADTVTVSDTGAHTHIETCTNKRKPTSTHTLTDISTHIHVGSMRVRSRRH
jgi:hypothetical protein